MVFKCERCNAELDWQLGETVCVCPYCNSKQTVPYISNHEELLKELNKKNQNVYEKALVFLKDGCWERANKEFSKFDYADFDEYKRNAFIGKQCCYIKMKSVDEFKKGELLLLDEVDEDRFEASVLTQTGLYILKMEFDGEENFKEAFCLFDKAYDKCPTYPFLYIGKLMEKRKIRELSTIPRFYAQYGSSIKNESEYQTAYNYADGNEKAFLDVLAKEDKHEKKRYDSYKCKFIKMIEDKKRYLRMKIDFDKYPSDYPLKSLYEHKKVCICCGHIQLFGSVEKCKKCGTENKYYIAKRLPWYYEKKDNGFENENILFRAYRNKDADVKIFKNGLIDYLSIGENNIRIIYEFKVKEYDFKAFESDLEGHVLGPINHITEKNEYEIIPRNPQNGEYAFLVQNPNGEEPSIHNSCAYFFNKVNGEFGDEWYKVDELKFDVQNDFSCFPLKIEL